MNRSNSVQFKLALPWGPIQTSTGINFDSILITDKLRNINIKTFLKKNNICTPGNRIFLKAI